MTGGWFIVDVVGPVPSVLRIGANRKQWRPLSNEFRGAVHRTIVRLVETVIYNRKQSQTLVDLSARTSAVACPVLGSTRVVHGVLLWIGEHGEVPSDQPVTHVWEWDLADCGAPAPDRPCPVETAVTSTELLSRLVRPGDIMELANDVRTARAGFHRVGEWLTVGAELYRYSSHCVRGFDGLRMVVLSVRTGERVPDTHPELVARRVMDATCRMSGVAPALVSARTGRVLAWLSSNRPDDGVTLGEDPGRGGQWTCDVDAVEAGGGPGTELLPGYPDLSLAVFRRTPGAG
ncbi:DUF5593 domain-containing protein [Corynebacterium bovis]|uniref:GAF domain-containing protein n=1 Tax=Corynebacterium bovis TaxID=36808 RepID=UPI00244BDA89|nr:GAF domain-containing protein [Corynebacterium bovis]MDH2456742.1 DUF5593 domain-containing protein [Corynebacterium bovis]